MPQKAPSHCSISILARVLSVTLHALQEWSTLYITNRKAKVLTAHNASHFLSCHLVDAAPSQHHLLCSFTNPLARLLEQAFQQTNTQHDACTGNGIMQRLLPLLTFTQASPVRLVEAWQLCTCICCSRTAACAGPSCAPSYAASTQPQTCSPLELLLPTPGL